MNLKHELQHVNTIQQIIQSMIAEMDEKYACEYVRCSTDTEDYIIHVRSVHNDLDEIYLCGYDKKGIMHYFSPKCNFEVLHNYQSDDF